MNELLMKLLDKANEQFAVESGVDPKEEYYYLLLQQLFASAIIEECAIATGKRDAILAHFKIDENPN